MDKKLRLCSITLVIMLLMLLVIGTNVSATTIADLQTKLDEKFPDGEMDLKVSSSYENENFQPQEFASMFQESIFGDDYVVSYTVGNVTKKAAASIYQDWDPVANEPLLKVAYMDIETTDILVTKNLTLNIITVEPNQAILQEIENLRTKASNNLTLAYDDLNWINKLLATDLEGFRATNSISIKNAKYIMSFFTGLKDGITVGIDPRMGCDAIVGNEFTRRNTIAELFAGLFPIIYDGVIYDVIDSCEWYNMQTGEGDLFSITYYNTIDIPNTTVEADYISVVTERINDYINNSDYEVTVTKTNKVLSDIEYDPELHADLITGAENSVYNLNIKKTGEASHDYYFLIKKVPSSEIKVPTVQYLEKENYIYMETNSSDIPANSVIEAIKVTDANRIAKINEYTKASESIAFDISLKGANGYIRTIENGIVTIKIPLPDGWDETKAEVHYVNDDGTDGEEFNKRVETINGKKYFVFETNHFSTYVIKKDEAVSANTKDKTPKTGVTVSVLPLAFIVVVSGIKTTMKICKKR